MRSAMVRCDECGHGPITLAAPEPFQITNVDAHQVPRTYDFCTWDCALTWLDAFAETGHPPLELSEFGRVPRKPVQIDAWAPVP